MIVFTAAMYPEAKSLIRKFSMKKQIEEKYFQIFEGEMDTVLLLTGVGKMKAAIAVSHYLTLLCERGVCLDRILLVNLGTAGEIGNDFLETGTDWIGMAEEQRMDSCQEKVVYASSVLDDASGRWYFPDLYSISEKEICMGNVITYDHVLKTGGNGKEDLYNKVQMADMEAAGILEAARSFLSMEQILIFKVKSDRCKGEEISPAFIEERMDESLKAILSMVLRIEGERESYSRGRNGFLSEEWKKEAEKICENWHCSETMKNRLFQVLRFCAAKSGNEDEETEKLLADALKVTVSQGKREGKEKLEELNRQLIERQMKKSTEESEIKETIESKEIIEPRELIDSYQKKEIIQIYVEKEIVSDIETQKILKRFSEMGIAEDRITVIPHYKEIVNRAHQNFAFEKRKQAIVLAKKEGQLVYEGAAVCQSFGNRHFYYTSVAMNCIYDCEYCYLQGMYQSGVIAVFLNLEDIFREVKELLKKHPVYLCVSFDTDLLAMEKWFHYAEKWYDFAKNEKDLLIELRTKSNGKYFLSRIAKKQEITAENVILAWTISPETVIRKYEHGTASLSERLSGMKLAAELGFPVRVCFDPLLMLSDFKGEYQKLVSEVFSALDAEKICDVSVGVFRVSLEYLKNMRKNRKDSELLQYPYRSSKGVAHFGEKESSEMMDFVKKEIEKYLPSEKIFLWE